MKQYRIGDFAKYVGVTPDLLKHYEDIGLVTPERSESGYRYYSFQTTMFLMECIRLRNYGIPLREIKDVLAGHVLTNEQMHARFSQNIEHMREEILLDEALIQDYQEFQDWKAPLLNADSDWEIRWSKPMCFLPHTDRDDFLQDERIYALLKDWMSYIPIVKSSIRMKLDGTMSWGLMIEEQKQQALHLPVNEVVEHIPSHKVFYFKFKSSIVAMQQGVQAMAAPALEKLHQLGLAHEDVLYRTTLMPANWREGIQQQYGYYAIPLTV